MQIGELCENITSSLQILNPLHVFSHGSIDVLFEWFNQVSTKNHLIATYDDSFDVMLRHPIGKMYTIKEAMSALNPLESYLDESIDALLQLFNHVLNKASQE